MTVLITYYPASTVRDLQKFSKKEFSHSVVEGSLNNVPPDKVDLLIIAAAENDKLEWLAELLKKGGNPNAADEFGYTSLMAAARKGHIDIVKFLLKNGADVNAKANNGMTALVAAVQSRQTEIVKEMVAKGADVNAKCCGKSVLMFAKESGQSEIVEVLKKAGAR